MTQLTPDKSEAVTRHALESTLQAMDPLMRSLDIVPHERLGEQPVPEQLPLGKMIEHSRTEQLFVSPKTKETADYIEGRFG